MTLNARIVVVLSILLNVAITSSIFAIIWNAIELPEINASLDISDISDEGIYTSLKLNINDSSGMSLRAENVRISIFDDKGNEISKAVLKNMKISSGYAYTTQDKFKVPLDVLNCQKITVKVHAKMVMGIMGLEKTLPLDISFSIFNPVLSLLISPESFDMGIKNTYKITRQGFVNIATVEIVNPYNISVLFKNFTLSRYWINENDENLIHRTVLGSGVAGPKGKLTFSKTIVMPYKNIITFRFRIVKAVIESTVYISSINQPIKLRLISYTYPDIFIRWGNY